jgi:8-oxo-dGTP diphosphatase
MTTQRRDGRSSGGRRGDWLTSAGGVVYRPLGDGHEILLCHRREPVLWCLPKGTPNEGEAILATALREVQEETGYQAKIVGKLGVIRYFFYGGPNHRRLNKQVYHYLMVPMAGDTALHDHEFDEVHWVPIEEAIATMSYSNEIDVVRKAADVLAGKAPLEPLTRRRSGRRPARAQART